MSLDLSSLPEKSQRDVPRVVNRLLGQTFLYQDKDDDKDDYYFVHRYRQNFEELLAMAGFSLLHDDYHRIFQAVSDYSYCRAHYKLDETLMIVVLRKLYEERSSVSAWRMTRWSRSERCAKSTVPSLAKSATWASFSMKPCCAACGRWG
jgi:hypothetical protein